MPNLLQSLLSVGCALFTAVAAAAPAETICSDRPELLAKREGVYASKQMVDAVRMGRRWDRGQPDSTGISELRVSRSGGVGLSFGWHEAGTLGAEFKHGCLVFDGNLVRLRHSQFDHPVVLERLGSTTASNNDDALYFDLLFKGCFDDQDGQRWCFRTNVVEVAATPRRATLKLDLSELPAGGSVLEIAGERDFWLFVPRGQGWAVHRTTWASADNYVEPTWSRPWKVLTPVK